jgi:general secretion pathway protein F
MGRSFEVRALSGGQGLVQTVVVEANSADQAKALLIAQGFGVLSARRLQTAQPTGVPLSSGDLAWWCQELKTLLRAGMTVVEALETLQAQSQLESGNRGARHALQAELIDRLRQGDSLSHAMEIVGGFPAVLRASVQAAERTRGLSEALEEYLKYHEVLARLRRRVISASVYPAMVCGVGLLVIGFLLIVVMPRFAGVLSDSPSADFGASGWLMGLSSWLSSHMTIVATVFATAVGALVLLGQRGVLLRWTLAAAGQVPWVARALWHFEMAKLFQSLTVLFRGGFPVEQAVGLCQEAAERPDLAARLARCQTSLLQGQRVAQALAEAGLTDEVSLRLLGVGERSGGFDTVLQVIAERHAQTFSDFMDRLMRIVEPALLLLVASAVGGVVVMMYLPIFDIATGLQR